MSYAPDLLSGASQIAALMAQQSGPGFSKDPGDYQPAKVKLSGAEFNANRRVGPQQPPSRLPRHRRGQARPSHLQEVHQPGEAGATRGRKQMNDEKTMTIHEQAQQALHDLHCTHPDTGITRFEAVLARIGADSPTSPIICVARSTSSASRP
jgi:hypothetical protein